MKDTSIKEIMTGQVQSLSPNSDVMEAKSLMEKFNIHHLPIVLDGELVGILSSNDINNVVYLCDFIGDKLEDSKIFQSLSIHEVMTKDVTSIDANSKISEAILLFSNVSFHCLPVMDDGELVGIVSSKDVFRFLTKD
ncbi:MAG: CBS domain-containing protein [Cyclobacteriaceae bacterium]